MRLPLLFRWRWAGAHLKDADCGMDTPGGSMGETTAFPVANVMLDGTNSVSIASGGTIGFQPRS